MKEYIERDAAIAFLENMAASRYLIQCFENKERFPAADVAPVVHGEWEIKKIGDGGTTRTCSNCNITQTVNIYNNEVMFRYCPYCGAKMDGGNK